MKNTEEKASSIDKLYIEWIAWFCEKNAGFSNDLYKYNNEGVSKINIENVEKLELFFRKIENYADNNGVEPSMTVGDFVATKSYYLEYKNLVYAVGYICDHDTIFYCSRVHSEIDPEKIVKYEDLEEFLNIKTKVIGNCDSKKPMKKIRRINQKR